MRHRRAGRKLGRNATHRLALYRNLALALFRHERIITTVEKAKAVRPFVEKLITLAREGTLHARRLVIARLGPMSGAEVKPASDEEGKEKPTPPDERTIVQKLFEDLGPRFKDRPGGYTRIVKRDMLAGSATAATPQFWNFCVRAKRKSEPGPPLLRASKSSRFRQLLRWNRRKPRRLLLPRRQRRRPPLAMRRLLLRPVTRLPRPSHNLGEPSPIRGRSWPLTLQVDVFPSLTASEGQPLPFAGAQARKKRRHAKVTCFSRTPRTASTG